MTAGELLNFIYNSALTYWAYLQRICVCRDAGTIFSVGRTKIGENNQDNQIQNITFMQYVFFLKKSIIRRPNYNADWGKTGKAHRNWGGFGEQDVLLAPPIILLEESCSPCPFFSRAYGCVYV